MSITIDPYKARDEQGIIDLILPIQNEEFGIPITLKDQPDLQKIPEVYLQGVGNFWVACEGDKIVGSIALIDVFTF